ncbi:HIT family protein [soil metagenome]
MPTVFTRIIEGQLPARFVWSDERCVAFLSANPMRTGHTLVVPREEVDHWIDLDPGLLHHLSGVAQQVGAALQRAYDPGRIGLMIAGQEVPHVHLHVVPMDDLGDLDFAKADPDPDEAAMDEAADAVRSALRSRGASAVPAD